MPTNRARICYKVCYAALGDGGKVNYVNPAKNLAAAIASLFMPCPKDRTAFIREVLELMFEDQE